MDVLKQTFPVYFSYAVHFTSNLFEANNLVLRNVLKKESATAPVKILIFIDDKVIATQPCLYKKILSYAKTNNDVINLCHDPFVIEGGEAAKNYTQLLDKIYQPINSHGICRHSYILAIGGGALLDMVGYAAATAHRGIRLIRIPSTTLAQADSGVGVKNGINYFNKKNFLGTFSPPYAILNDFNFLKTLDYRDWLAGIAEAVKVSLIKDDIFFQFIRTNTHALSQQRNLELMSQLIYRCAELHMLHIANAGDPFEFGSSRPLDFGHWAAHKLEQLTQYRLRHGEAVAIGIALDSTYSYLAGLLPREDWQQILNTLFNLGFVLYVPELSLQNLFQGLTDFREHLGGKLTIMMLEKIGKGIEVHTVDINLFQQAITLLKNLYAQHNDLSQQVLIYEDR